jgi:glycosyltransferase involved in cell wall biosynthesis
MRLDVVIATYNRAPLLKRLLDSLRAATVPESLTMRVLVVDNNSSDNTRTLVEAILPEWDSLVYMFERTQGKSAALNTGLANVKADLVGMVDDDEEVHEGWLHAIDDIFRDETIDFVSGPCLPRWAGPIPAWLPPDYPAIIGWVEAGDQIREYGKDYTGIMMGGNAVLRTSALRAVGGYNPTLGRTGTNLCSGEDADLHDRLLATGARGVYYPQLVIYHYVPPERLTKKYFRRWCLHHGVTKAAVDRLRPEAVPYLCGVPRYVIGKALRSAMFLLRSAIAPSSPARSFSSELAIWDLCGFLYGKYVVTPAKLAGRMP